MTASLLFVIMVFALFRVTHSNFLDQTHRPLGLRLNWFQLRVSRQYSFLLESSVVDMIKIQLDINSVLERHLPPALSVLKQLNTLNLCGSVAGMESLAQRYLFTNNQEDN